MKDAWKRSRVPIVGLIGIALVTLIAFAAVRPDLLQRQEQWSITGNVVADELFFPSITPSAPCSALDEPVCGADGETYRNLCHARKAGTDMQHLGPCSGWVRE